MKLEPPFQKYKGRVVLRGEIVKDDSGSFAVFAEQGSSASQMTAAKVIDVIARLPGCAGQAAHAVISIHPSQNGRCTTFIINSKSQHVHIYTCIFIYLDTSTKTQAAEILVQYGRRSCSS